MPDRRSRCKGPEARPHLRCLRERQDINVAEGEQAGQRAGVKKTHGVGEGGGEATAPGN